jgi:hypothetical protein
LDGRKRVNSNLTDGVIEPKTKKHKNDWVSRKDYLRLKQVAREANPIGKKGNNELYDPWADDAEEPTVYEDPRFDFLVKPKAKVAPETLKHAPISLAANGKPIPAVRMPHAGTSYNPVFEDWDKLLQEHGEEAVEAEKKRLEEELKEQERQRLIAEAQNDDGEVKSDDESAWEGFESEYEKPEWLNKKRPERKTKTQRNKIKRRKEAERQAKWEEQKAKKDAQAERIVELTELAKQKELERANQSDGDDSEEGDETALRRKPFAGKLAYVIPYVQIDRLLLTLATGPQRSHWSWFSPTSCRTLSACSSPRVTSWTTDSAHSSSKASSSLVSRSHKLARRRRRLRRSGCPRTSRFLVSK